MTRLFNNLALRPKHATAGTSVMAVGKLFGCGHEMSDLTAATACSPQNVSGRPSTTVNARSHSFTSGHVTG